MRNLHTRYFKNKCLVCGNTSRSQQLKGFSLIDVIVGTALLLVLFLALFGVLRASLSLSILTKAKATAVELANTQMEYLRGISYDAIGTSGGIPAGTVLQYKTSIVDGVPYNTHTFIKYYDDPADGLGINDTNNITTDYKIGEVTVSYSVYGLTKSVTLVTDFAPPGEEKSTGGGLISIHVVNAGGVGVASANVHIINTATTPTIDLTTFTNITGMVTLDGSATSSEYQIYVSRSGYSSAQTYARSSININPNPGYLTIVKNQTTSATFFIDKLATLILSTFSPATTTAFTDSFADTSNLAKQTNTQVASGVLTLANDTFSGSAYSIPIVPSNLDGWGIISATIATSTNTSAVVYVEDSAKTILPDSILPGNSLGFSTFPISLAGIATSSYPGLSLKVSFTRVATTSPVSLSSWSLSHTSGPSIVPNIAFTLTGTKTIGTDSSNAPIYKTIVNGTTGATGIKSESLEWDSYSLTTPSANIIEICSPSPLQLAPNSTTITKLIVGNLSTNTLPIIIEDSTGNVVGNAKVILSNSNYSATIPTSVCGLSYFNNLTAGSYTAKVSASGYATTTKTNITVLGHTTTATITLP